MLNNETNLMEYVDCQVSFCVGQKPDNGEDCETHAVNRAGALIGVFDGCGGAGARSYAKLSQKTGAYIASRAVGEAFFEWFELGCAGGETELKSMIKSFLQKCDQTGGETVRIRGSVSKTFPTTAAAAVCGLSGGQFRAKLYWAGDSRVYFLDSGGLRQLTEDDLGGINAMENLSADGVLTNVISLSQDYSIHTAQMTIDKPGFLFCATDGCFGYYSTPMEFEYLLLSSLLSSQSVCEWEKKMKSALSEISGDDYSLSGLVLGCGSFINLQRLLVLRAKYIYEQYIRKLADKNAEEKYALWETYRREYEALMIRV